MKYNTTIYLLEVTHTINNKLKHKTILAIYSSYKKAKTSLKINREVDENLYKDREYYFLSEIGEQDIYSVRFKDESNNLHRFIMYITPRQVF